MAYGLVHAALLNQGGGGTVYDDSGHGATGTLTLMDANTDWIGSPYGHALDLDGSNDEVVFPAAGPVPLPSTGLTVAGLFNWRTNATSSWANLFGMTRTVNSAPYLMWSIMQNAASANIYATMNVGGTQRNTGTKALTLNTWYHLAMTWQSGDFGRLYVDGAQAAVSAAAYSGTITYYTAGWSLGRNYNAAGRMFNGQCAGVWVWDRGMSPAAIAAAAADPFEAWRPRRVYLYRPAVTGRVYLGETTLGKSMLREANL